MPKRSFKWEKHGICNRYMRKCCKEKGKCRFKHPDPEDRARLLQDHGLLFDGHTKARELQTQDSNVEVEPRESIAGSDELIGGTGPNKEELGSLNTPIVSGPENTQDGIGKEVRRVASTTGELSHVQATLPSQPGPFPPNAELSLIIPPSTIPSPSAPTAFDDEVMAGQKRFSNGEVKCVGPDPSTIRVSAQYITQAAIDVRLQSSSSDAQERSLAEAKEDSLRLQGTAWIDTVRQALQLPVRTYTTACIYFHKFRLSHPPGTTTGDGYLWSDAAAASLLTACKVEDTLKKSREILAAAYNTKVAATHEQLSADDPLFEQPSRVVLGLERLVLEAGSFDFRSRFPHRVLVKLAKQIGHDDQAAAVGKLAWTVLTDLHRTFASLKHTSATLSIASLELAARLLQDESAIAALQALDLNRLGTSRAEIMEVLLDALDHYTHHTTHSILGSRFGLDDFLRIRLHFNKECQDDSIPRYCKAPTPALLSSKVQHGHPTPVSPPQNAGQASLINPQPGNLHYAEPAPGGGTLRFMLSPALARNEKEEVLRYITEEWEEYEEEIEVPIAKKPHHPSSLQGSSRASSRDRRPDGRRDEQNINPPTRGGPHGGYLPRAIDRDRERERLRERERMGDRDRDQEREHVRARERDRDRRYDDDRRHGRGYDERYGRRYDDHRRRRYEPENARR